jgi:hypothetical protein
MQLICPHCGEPVSAEHINIQRMAAVCPACHSVFQFEPSDSKTKRRKVKQPQQITSAVTDGHLKIAFRTNFRLDKNEAFLSSAGFSLLFTFITLILVSKSLRNPESAFLTLGFGLLTLVLYYWLALLTYNKTHIEISDEAINVSRKPLPNLLSQTNTVNVSGIEMIRYEETAASKKEGYDTPRYNVWAEMVEGKHKLIVGDVIEDYAVFVSQRLNEFLDVDTAPEVSRLVEDGGEVDDGQVADGFSTQSKSPRT